MCARQTPPQPTSPSLGAVVDMPSSSPAATMRTQCSHKAAESDWRKNSECVQLVSREEWGALSVQWDIRYPFTISPPHEDSELGWDGFISAADPTSRALCVGRTHRGPVLSGTASIRLSGIKGNTGKGLVFQGKSPHKGKPAESLLEQWGTACPGPPPQTGGEDVHQCAPVIRTPGT